MQANTLEQLDGLKKERHQLEELLLQTQRENERCQEEVRRWKSYARSLEKEIEHFAGPNWQQRLDVPPTPQPPSLPHYPSTPLTSGPIRNDYLETPLPGNARPGVVNVNNDGWLGGTPVTAFKSKGMGGVGGTAGHVEGDKFITPTALHRLTRSNIEPVLSPEETQTPRSNDGNDSEKDKKAKRRVSAYMEYEEMVLPTLRKSPVPIDGKDYGEFGELGAKSEKDRGIGERGSEWSREEGDGMVMMVGPKDCQSVKSFQEISEKDDLDSTSSQRLLGDVAASATASTTTELQSSSFPSPTVSLSTSLATQLLTALQNISNAPPPNPNVTQQQQQQQQRDDQRHQNLLRGIRKQADGVKGYVRSSSKAAEERLEKIREMMKMAQEEAAKWREDVMEV